jgi:hypothetical protein
MDRIDRRRLLIGGTASALGLAAVALGPTTAMADDSEGPVGTWDLQITDATAPAGTPSVFEGATTFAPGGGLVSMDANSPSTGLGSWSGGEDGAFKARFMQFAFDPSGNAKLVVAIKGQTSAKTISGTFTYKVYAPNGTLLFGDGHGTFAGTKFASA